MIPLRNAYQMSQTRAWKLFQIIAIKKIGVKYFFSYTDKLYLQILN